MVSGRIDWNRVLLRLFYILFPFFIASVYIMGIYAVYPKEIFVIIGAAMLAYFFPPAGKESVIPITMGYLLAMNRPVLESVLLVATSIAFVDIDVALFLAWNFDLALKIPLVGRFIRKVESKGHSIMARRKMLNWSAFLGLVLFVIVPFQGSGALTTTIIGRIIGMEKFRVFLAITIGALLGCYMIAIGVGYGISYLGLWVVVPIVALLAIILFVSTIIRGEKGDK